MGTEEKQGKIREKNSTDKGNMTDNNSTGTTELADRRPSEGEYFYREGIEHYSGSNASPMCFACDNKSERTYNYWHIHAIAQCAAAKRRIISMFKPGACHDPGPRNDGGTRIIVSVCEEHKHHAEILYRLTADGCITLERVQRAEKALISRPEFNQLVAEEAQAIWSRNEGNRRHHNWCDAWPLFIKETGRIPSLAERTERAWRLSDERKEAQAKEDWLKAEKKVAALYKIEAP